MIEEAYVSFEVAKLLKEKGFDVDTPTRYAIEKVTESWYDDYRERVVKFDWDSGYFLGINDIKHDISGDTISAPTQQMAMQWLRKMGWFIHIDVIREVSCWTADIQDIKNDVAIYAVEKEFPNYEQACEAAIKYCLENLI